MKVKFLSKKQREQLKQQKSNNEASPNTNIPSSIREKIDQLYQKQQTDNSKPSEPAKEGNHKKTSHFSEHFIGLENQENVDEKRERSRDKKYEQLVQKEEQVQRQKMKKTVLGLVKLEPPPRNNITYRNQLLFQWNKNDDTSQGFVPIINLDGFHKPKDALQKDSNENWKNKPYERMEQRDWRIFREDHEIYIRGGKAPNPIRQWRQLQGISERLISNLLSLKFEKPKPIQMQAVPIGINRKDLMAIAPTGQGKTLAYLLPIIHFLLPLERLNMISFDNGPYALVIVPTRELAEQIQEQFKKITKGLSLTAFCAVGGYQFQLQAMQLSKGCQLLIATPGRVKQFIEKHQLSLQRLSWLVIDQADKMVSENLSEDIEFILENSGQQSTESQNHRKTIHMFSATMIPEIQKLAKSYLAASYTYITIGEPGGGKKQIQQHVQLINETSKLDHVSRILRRLEGPIIVFVNSRQNCEKVAKMIEKRCERKIAQYHGGKSQQAREKVIAQFRTGKIQILIATDLAGRGLDVKGINAVINYDAPKNISQFIHRSGRTGRAGMKGKAFTFLTPQDEGIFYDIRVFLERNGFSIPQNLKDNPASQVRPGGVLNVARRKQIVYTN